MEIANIRDAILAEKLRITDHADEEAVNDVLSMSEVFTSVMSGEVIETYDNDKPYPSCLIYGLNDEDEPIHSVWAYNKMNGYAVLITVYHPDPALWINFRERKR